jgi:hypothetical protein
MQIKKEIHTKIKHELQKIINKIIYDIQNNTREIAHLAQEQKGNKKQRTKIYEFIKILNNQDEKLQTFIEKEVCINTKYKLQGLINDINYNIQKNKIEINSLDRKQNKMKKEHNKLYELMRMLK